MNNLQSSLLDVLTKNAYEIITYLDVSDIIQLSVTAKAFSSFVISQQASNSVLKSCSSINRIGNFALHFQSAMTLGMIRRVSCRLLTEREAAISVESSGRIIIDIGSALNDRDIRLVDASLMDDFEDSMWNENNMIIKQIEISSVDEYDDFTSVFPAPKEKGHRRGNSYFNSDVEMCASLAVEFELKDVAMLAQNLDSFSISSSCIPSVRHIAKRTLRCSPTK